MDIKAGLDRPTASKGPEQAIITPRDAAHMIAEVDWNVDVLEDLTEN
jgi:hypothetical protein